MRIILLFCGLLFFACGDVAMEIKSDEQELYQNYRLLESYFYHPERIKQYEEYRGMEIDTMYESLEDYFCGANYVGICPARYTFYVPPEEANKKIDGIEKTPKYYSFGFEMLVQKDTMVISAVYPISPAAEAGLRKHDRLLFANDLSLIGEEVIDSLLNAEERFADPTAFIVLRGKEIVPLPAMRKREVQRPTVYLDSLEGIPLIRITEYKVNTNNPYGTYAEFKNVLQEIKGAKTAIMDLRGNPGGNIVHCTAMAAELVPLNSELVYDVQHYRDGKRGNVIGTLHDYAKDYLEREGAGINIKWIILINRGSASCSERFTAAVKYNRPETVVIGQTSYGKGVGQIYTKTYMGGLAYITCLQTFYPDGTTFHNIGIIPDIPTDPGDIDAPYDEAIKAAQNFGLAKRSSMPIRSGALPPERLADKWEPGAYKRIEMPLFHEGE
jgi:C-terminal peptidase prc